MKRYTFKQTQWYQEELAFGEDGEVKKIVSDALGGVEMSENNVADIVDKLHNNGGLERIFKIILKPYEPTFFGLPFHRWWNKFWARHHKLDRSNIILQLPNTFVAEVNKDFFSFNPYYLTLLSSLALALGLSDTTAMQEMLSGMRRQSILSQMETSQRPN